MISLAVPPVAAFAGVVLSVVCSCFYVLRSSRVEIMASSPQPLSPSRPSCAPGLDAGTFRSRALSPLRPVLEGVAARAESSAVAGRAARSRSRRRSRRSPRHSCVDYESLSRRIVHACRYPGCACLSCAVCCLELPACRFGACRSGSPLCRLFLVWGALSLCFLSVCFVGR